MAEKTNDVQRNWLQAYYKETVAVSYTHLRAHETD